MELNRREALSAGIATIICRPALAQAGQMTDHAGRTVPIPPTVGRVLPAGPPASILLYTAAPDLLLGWPRALSPEERAFILPDVAARPEVGRLTALPADVTDEAATAAGAAGRGGGGDRAGGRGSTANLELIVKLKPDLI